MNNYLKNIWIVLCLIQSTVILFDITVPPQASNIEVMNTSLLTSRNKTGKSFVDSRILSFENHKNIFINKDAEILKGDTIQVLKSLIFKIPLYIMTSDNKKHPTLKNMYGGWRIKLVMLWWLLTMTLLLFSKKMNSELTMRMFGITVVIPLILLASILTRASMG